MKNVWISCLIALLLVPLSACDDTEPEVLGCMDANSTNFNSDATKDDGSCTYEVVGCTDVDATNYNSEATKDDGSCTYPVVLGCTDPTSNSYNPNATDDDGSCVYNETMPSAFRQNVLIEYFTGNWCGFCPNGQVAVDVLLQEHSERIFVAIPHTKDAMMLPEYREYMKFQLNGGFAPGATINRRKSNASGEVYVHVEEWEELATGFLNAPNIDIGLAIETSLNGDQLIVDTHVGFAKDRTEDFRLFVLVLEDSVIGSGDDYDQENYLNDDSSHPYYDRGDPIMNYPHQFVLRAYSEDVDGMAIPDGESTANNQYTRQHTFNVASNRKDQLYIVAFVVEDKGDPVDSPIINVLQVKAGGNRFWR